MSIMWLFGEYENTFEVSLFWIVLVCFFFKFKGICTVYECMRMRSNERGGWSGKMNEVIQIVLDFCNPNRNHMKRIILFDLLFVPTNKFTRNIN